MSSWYLRLSIILYYNLIDIRFKNSVYKKEYYIIVLYCDDSIGHALGTGYLQLNSPSIQL